MEIEKIKEILKKFTNSDIYNAECVKSHIEAIRALENRYKIEELLQSIQDICFDIRAKNEDDSVCGLCEYDGAYIGESGDWYNECPGFNTNECFKLKESINKKYMENIEEEYAYWKSREEYKDYLWAECSNCGFQKEAYEVVETGKSSTDYTDVKWHFCPKCGKRMRIKK